MTSPYRTAAKQQGTTMTKTPPVKITNARVTERSHDILVNGEAHKSAISDIVLEDEIKSMCDVLDRLGIEYQVELPKVVQVEAICQVEGKTITIKGEGFNLRAATHDVWKKSLMVDP